MNGSTLHVGRNKRRVSLIFGTSKGTFTGDRLPLTEEQKAYLRGKRYENEKLKHGGDRKKESNPQNEDLKTSEKLATEYNVSKATIERDADFAKGVDLLPEQTFPKNWTKLAQKIAAARRRGERHAKTS